MWTPSRREPFWSSISALTNLPSEVDCSFFLVTVDLWSADSVREMNLVMHPSSPADRCAPVGANKSKRLRGSNPTLPSPRSEHPSPPSSHSTPSSATEPSRIPMDQQVSPHCCIWETSRSSCHHSRNLVRSKSYGG